MHGLASRLFYIRNFMKFRKKPIVINAEQYSRIGLDAERVAKWCGGHQTDEGLEIETPEGTIIADYGDWIIQGIKGEFYPCKIDIFEATYEAVDD